MSVDKSRSGLSAPLTLVMRRFWAPVGQPTTFSEGFLSSRSSWFRSAAVRSTDELVDVRALLLVGPPGSGKSTLVGSVDLRPKQAPAGIVILRAKEIDGSVRSWLQQQPPVNAWLSATDESELCLVLDGVDEGAVVLTNFAQALVAVLDSFPLERLWLRITCRSGDLPEDLRRWAEDKLGAQTWQLLPFTREDVRAACARVPDRDGLIGAIEARALGALASAPVTLRLLATEWADSKGLSDTRAEVYGHGLMALLEESHNTLRASWGRADRPNGVRRFDVLASLAAASTFCGLSRFGVRGGVPDASIDEISRDLRLDASDARDVLRTSAFLASDSHQFVWAQQTFVEYLAAAWCAGHLSQEQVKGVLCAEQGVVRPRFRWVARWLVSLNPRQYDWLVRLDPVSFASGVDCLDAEQRELVVDRLLRNAAGGFYVSSWREDYAYLGYPGLATQLSASLEVGTWQVRYLAANLVGQTRTPELRGALVARALDPVEDSSLRNHFGLVAHHLDESADDLVGLLDPSIRPDDPQLELLGLGVLASFPHALTVRAALAHLSAEPDSHIYGNYDIAMRLVADAISSTDLPAAAEWMAQPCSRSYGMRPLRDAVLRVCADFPDMPGAIDALVTDALATVGRNAEYPGLEDEPFTSAQRRRVADALLEALRPPEIRILAELGALLQPEDLIWLLERRESLAGEKYGSVREWAEMLWSESPNSEVAHLLADVPPGSPLRAGDVAYMFDPDGGIDPRQRIALEELRQRQELRQAETDAANARFRQEVRELLDEASRQPATLDVVLAKLSGRPSARDWPELDLTRTAHYRLLEQEDRARLAALCPDYLATHAPAVAAGGLVNPNAASGIQALRLVATDAPDRLEELPASIWEAWGPLLWTASPDTDGDTTKALLRQAAAVARTRMTQGLLKRIESPDPSLSYAEINALWSAELKNGLSAYLLSKPEPSVRRRIVAIVGSIEPPILGPVATEWLHRMDADSDIGRDGTAILLTHLDLPESEHLVTLIQTRAALVSDALEQTVAARLPRILGGQPDTLTHLYEWMRQEHPPTQDGNTRGARSVTSRENISEWRDSLLPALSGIATPASVQAIATLQSKHPTWSELRPALTRAQQELANVWSPATPRHLSRLEDQRTSRWVASSETLLELTVEALETVQGLLIGDTPESRLLWDTYSKRHKSEDEMSDYVLHRLRERLKDQGIILDREVQVARLRPSGIPDRTDILVQAIDAIGSQIYTVIVECKGSWNPELITAPQQQLCNRYLARYPGSCGIYLTFWPEAGSTKNAPDHVKRTADTDAVSRAVDEVSSPTGSIRHIPIRIP